MSDSSQTFPGRPDVRLKTVSKFTAMSADRCCGETSKKNSAGVKTPRFIDSTTRASVHLKFYTKCYNIWETPNIYGFYAYFWANLDEKVTP